jgi:hypothetical protein
MKKTCQICRHWRTTGYFKPNTFAGSVALAGCGLDHCLTVGQDFCSDFAALPTVALSVRQPWGELIVKGVKDIENRSRVTHYRGPVLIHASKHVMTHDEWMDFVDWTELKGAENCLETHPQDLQMGGIIGVAEIVDCVSTGKLTASPWFVGPWGWKLVNARTLPFKACKGALGFFKCDYTAL